MIVKIFGILLLSASTLYAAIGLAHWYGQKTKRTEGLLLLLRHIRAKISCFSTPIDGLLDGFSNDALECCGFLTLARTDGVVRAVEEGCEKCGLSREQADLLLAMWGQLGDGYRDNAVGVCDYYISTLESALAHEREEHPRMARMARGVVLTGGLMLIIVLI